MAYLFSFFTTEDNGGEQIFSPSAAMVCTGRIFPTSLR